MNYRSQGQKFTLKSLTRNGSSLVLVLAMFGISTLLGSVIAGLPGILFATGLFVIALVAQEKVPLEVMLKIQGAHPIHPFEHRELYELAGTLAARAGLNAVPMLYWLPSPAPNAFATQQGNKTVIAVSSGLMQNLSAREIQGVLAHEIAHLKNENPRLLKVAQAAVQVTGFLSTWGQIMALILLPLTLVGFVSYSFQGLAILILAPWASVFLQAALSRGREWEADRVGAELSRDPVGLATALRKMQDLTRPWIYRFFGNANRLKVPEYLKSHPETSSRIKRLKEMEKNYPGPIVSPYWSSPPQPTGRFYPGPFEQWLLRVIQGMLRGNGNYR